MNGVRQSRGLIRRERVNVEIASRLEEVGHLLHAQGGNAFRVEAYRRAAETVRTLDEPIADLFHREGLEGLDRLPTIGPTIARAIRSMVLTGVYPMLERLRESECLTSASAAGTRGGAGGAGRSAGVTRRVAAPSMS